MDELTRRDFLLPAAASKKPLEIDLRGVPMEGDFRFESSKSRPQLTPVVLPNTEKTSGSGEAPS